MEAYGTSSWGCAIALPSGEIAHFGGKVVKNVAGYDMCKLFLGSLGALGVIVEATFKLYALPERDETLLAVLPSLERGGRSRGPADGDALLPSQILLLDSQPHKPLHQKAPCKLTAAAALLLVNCEGMDEAVERQLADIARMCQGHAASTLQVLAGRRKLSSGCVLKAPCTSVRSRTLPLRSSPPPWG